MQAALVLGKGVTGDPARTAEALGTTANSILL